MIELFRDRKGKELEEKSLLIEELYRETGRLKAELNWLKKKLDLPVREKVILIERENKKIRIIRQAELPGIARSTVYLQTTLDKCNLKLIHLDL